uniref:RING-type E3 ubiquitin transferase n=1 Tax=Kalanchoe fedtschenkoi TaxID=63787 RepID=A0A7N0TXA3_KALFE
MTRDQHGTEASIISALSSLTQHQLSHLTHTISAHFHHHLRRLSALLSSPILFSQTLRHLHSLSLPQKSLLLSRHLLSCLRHLTAPFTTFLPPPPPLYSLRLQEYDSVLILLLLCDLHQNDPKALQAPLSHWRTLLITHMLTTMLNISSIWVSSGAVLLKYVAMVARCFNFATQAGSDQCIEVAASRAVVVSLTSVEVKAAKGKGEESCVICREEMSEGRDVCELPCQHLFHWMCILKWLRKRNTCPCCRFCLPSDDVYSEIRRLWGVVVEKAGGSVEEYSH